jgi:hypothetical protein
VSEEPVDFLEIQERLRHDTDGKLRRELEAQLAELQHRVKRGLDAGAAPDEFARLTALNDAVAAAGQVLARAWGLYHKG